MIQMNVLLEGDKCWPDLEQKAIDNKVIHLDGNDLPPIQVGVIEGGLASGRPSLTLRIDLPDGKVILAETTARLFCTSARIIMAKYPNLFEG